jgi:hypothetical protein
MAGINSTVVELLPRHLKDKGLKPASTGTGREQRSICMASSSSSTVVEHSLHNFKVNVLLVALGGKRLYLYGSIAVAEHLPHYLMVRGLNLGLLASGEEKVVFTWPAELE